jgi:hypothetical protein
MLILAVVTGVIGLVCVAIAVAVVSVGARGDRR